MTSNKQNEKSDIIWCIISFIMMLAVLGMIVCYILHCIPVSSAVKTAHAEVTLSEKRPFCLIFDTGEKYITFSVDEQTYYSFSESDKATLSYEKTTVTRLLGDPDESYIWYLNGTEVTPGTSGDIVLQEQRRAEEEKRRKEEEEAAAAFMASETMS